MDAYVRNGLLERARNEEELANRAIDNDLPSLAVFHQERAKELRGAAGEDLGIWNGIMPDTAADPSSVMGQKPFWLMLALALFVFIALGIIVQGHK